MKKSLNSNRWNAIDLGTPDQYTHDNMVARWVVEKNKWLHVSKDENALIYFSVNRDHLRLVDQMVRRMCEAACRAAQSHKVKQNLPGWLCVVP